MFPEIRLHIHLLKSLCECIIKLSDDYNLSEYQEILILEKIESELVDVLGYLMSTQDELVFL